jgi:hypothetical protein
MNPRRKWLAASLALVALILAMLVINAKALRRHRAGGASIYDDYMTLLSKANNDPQLVKYLYSLPDLKTGVRVPGDVDLTRLDWNSARSQTVPLAPNVLRANRALLGGQTEVIISAGDLSQFKAVRDTLENQYGVSVSPATPAPPT